MDSPLRPPRGCAAVRRGVNQGKCSCSLSLSEPVQRVAAVPQTQHVQPSAMAYPTRPSNASLVAAIGGPCPPALDAGERAAGYWRRGGGQIRGRLGTRPEAGRGTPRGRRGPSPGVRGCSPHGIYTPPPHSLHYARIPTGLHVADPPQSVWSEGRRGAGRFSAAEGFISFTHGERPEHRAHVRISNRRKESGCCDKWIQCRLRGI